MELDNVKSSAKGPGRDMLGIMDPVPDRQGAENDQRDPLDDIDPDVGERGTGHAAISHVSRDKRERVPISTKTGLDSVFPENWL